MTMSTPQVQWSKPESTPLDLDGPRDVPFRRFEESWIEQPAIELFARIADQYPDRTACEDISSRLTFAETWGACRRLAARIERAVAPGRAVGVLLPNEAAYPVAVLACLRAARPCVLIDRHYPQERVSLVVRDAGLSAVVLKQADIDACYLLPAGVAALPIEEALAEGDAPAGHPPPPAPADAPSFIVYTSGSTGRPKGIVLSQRAVLHRACELVNAVHLRPDDKVLSLASPGTIGGLQQIFEVMLSGATLVKLDLQRVGLGAVVNAVRERRITMMFSTPAVWRSVARLDGVRLALASLRCIQSSGDTLLRVDYDLIRTAIPAVCSVLSVYGATEAPALLQWFVAAPPEDEARIPAGYPLAGSDLAVLDEHGKAVPDGAAGELVIRSRFTSLGLWHDGQLRPGSFRVDPDDPRLNIYATGDLVRRRPDGLNVVLGRRDRQIKIRGNRVELAEIETALRRMPAVLDAVVIARQVEREPVLFAFTVGRDPQAPPDADDLRRDLAANLPAFMRPQRIVVLDSLPLLPGRKVDEEALMARALGGRPLAEAASAEVVSAEATASPRAIDWVGRAWQSALGRLPARDDLSFEQMGGDSLKLLQMVFHLERLAGRSLPIERFHGGLGLRRFAMALDRCLDGNDEEAPAERPVVFLFPPGGGADAHLSAFRIACEARLAIRQISYPDLAWLARPDASFECIAAHALRQILGMKPPGPLVLAGYSGGGDVAYAAARLLVAGGHDVALLCLLDTDASGLQYEEPPRKQLSLADELRRLVRGLGRLDSRRLVQLLLPEKLVAMPAGRRMARGLAAIGPALPASLSFLVSLHCLMILFHRLHRQWTTETPTPLLGSRVIVFRSQEPRPGAPDHLGWRARATDLSIVAVPGDHSTTLDAETDDGLRHRFVESVLAAKDRAV